jgi:hypothetical protein
MTITAVNQQPQAFSPAYNENIYLVTSSGTAQTNFRYVFDVYETNGSTLISRVKLPARPTDNRCVFDAKRVIENYLSYNLPTAQEQAGFYHIKLLQVHHKDRRRVRCRRDINRIRQPAGNLREVCF